MKEINQNDSYIVNLAYNLKEDLNRVLITTSNAIEYNPYQKNDSVLTGIHWFIHPVYAYFFSFFDGSMNFNDTLHEISKNLKISIIEAFNMIKPFVENQNTVYFHYKNFYFGIPQNFIILNKDKKVRNFEKSLFLEMSKFDNIDLTTWRLNKPKEFLLVINNKCITDCIYCYADKTHFVDKQIPFPRLKEIIEESRELKMRNIDISGGELFLYKDWFDLLKIMLDNGFYPYISTKVALNKNTINKLLDLNIKNIQLSFDSLDPNKIQKILNVSKEYLDKFKETIKNLNNAGISIKIKSVISNINCNYKDYVELIDYLMQFEHIEGISIAPGEPSLYKTHDFCTSYDDFIELKSHLQEYVSKQTNYQQKISFQDVLTKPSSNSLLREKEFNRRSLCSGNTTGFVLLPDGKVTICEQLYWHSKFIIGDLNKQSIMEMWNSKKALDLYHLSKRKVPNDSACRSCEKFKNCREQLGVCWKMIVFGYGYNNYYYPDPRCLKAPRVKNEQMYL